VAAFVLTSSQILLGQHNISNTTGQYAFGGSVDMQDATAHGGGGFTRVLPGLRSWTVDVSGWADYDAGQIASVLTPASVGSQQLVSIKPIGDTAGDPAHFVRGHVGSLNAPGGGVGDVATIEFGVESDAAGVDGLVAVPLATRTTTFSGAAQAITGPAAGQRMYAGLHVTAANPAAGRTLTVTVQSATTSGFGSPTTRITFDTMTDVGWQYASVPGSITDGWWRAVLTVAGTSPSFTASVVLGVR
jgi:hypothetical protein